MKLWTGRLPDDADELTNRLNASIGVDARMLAQDIRGSVAHATMLRSVGVLTSEEARAITDGLEGILADVRAGRLEIDPAAEDVHSFVEVELTARIGTPGKKLHTARSRNDQVATDLRLYLMEETDALLERSRTLALTLCDLAEAHIDTVMPGYTHLQRAQPVTLGHHLMAYCQMLLRDRARLSDCRGRTAVLPLGSGALAGTPYPLDRGYTASLLGFSSVAQNSMDAVSDRDFVLELAGCLSILMLHLSRLAEELILWCSWEYRFVTLADAYSTGSSIMPQKKNPDLAELVRGKTARVCGDMQTLFMMMKALPLAYHKDLQEDKEAIFDAVDTALLCLEALPPMLTTATFHKEAMRSAAAQSYINATDCADYLVGKGMPFRDAYRLCGSLVRACMERGCTLETLPMDVYRAHSALFAEDVYEAVCLLGCVMRRTAEGGPAPETVKQQIAQARERLNA